MAMPMRTWPASGTYGKARIMRRPAAYNGN